MANRITDPCDDPELPRISYEDIISDEGTLNKPVYELGHEKAGLGFERGDVLYGKLRPYLHNWLLPQFTGVALGDFWVLRPKGIDPEFLYRFVQSASFEKVANVSAGSKMPRADWKLVSSSFFAFPPNIIEQCAIGCFLRDIEGLITLHQRELDRINLMKTSLLQKMFPKPGCDVPELRFSGFTDPWERHELGELYGFKNGLNKGKSYFGRGIPIVNFTDVYRSRVLHANDLNGLVEASPSEVAALSVRKGDIFFTRTSETIEEVGMPSVMLDQPTCAVFSGFVLRGRALGMDPLDDLFKGYVFYSPAFRREIVSKSSMTTRALTSGAALRSMQLTFPSNAEEQHAIGALFQNFDKLISLRQRELETLKKLKKAFLQKMFV